MMQMRSRTSLLMGLTVLLAWLPSIAGAEGVGGYVGAGLGLPSVQYGSSSFAYKIFGGYKIHEFDIPKAGSIQLAVQGEYINFGTSSYISNSWTNKGVTVAAVGSWVIPEKWAAWADNKVAAIAKLGVGRVTEESNYGISYAYTGVTEGIGVDYRLIPMASVRAMIEYYPNGFDVIGVSGIFHF